MGRVGVLREGADHSVGGRAKRSRPVQLVVHSVGVDDSSAHPSRRLYVRELWNAVWSSNGVAWLVGLVIAASWTALGIVGVVRGSVIGASRLASLATALVGLGVTWLLAELLRRRVTRAERPEASS